MNEYGVDPYGRPAESQGGETDEERRRREEEEERRRRESQNTAQTTSQQPAAQSAGNDYEAKLAEARRIQQAAGTSEDNSSAEAYATGRMSLQDYQTLQNQRGASTNHRPYDSQSTNPAEQRANQAADVAAHSPLAGVWNRPDNQRLLQQQQIQNYLSNGGYGAGDISGAAPGADDGTTTNAMRAYTPYAYQRRTVANYTPGTLQDYTPQNIVRRELETYNPTELARFTPGGGGNIENLHTGLIERVLANPETLSPQVVAQMKEQAKEEALAFEQQKKDQLARDVLARGISGGGFQAAGERRLAGDTINSLVNANRGIDLAKVERDRADQISAADLGSRFVNDRFARAADVYTLNRDTALSNEDLRQRALDSRNKNTLFQSDQDRDVRDEGRYSYETNRSTALSREALQQEAIRAALANAAFDVDQQRTEADEGHFAWNTDAERARFGEGQRQFNRRLGYDYTALEAQQQQAMIAAIMNGLM